MSPDGSASEDTPTRSHGAARGFAKVATNVAVVTVGDDRGVHGCTANTWAEDFDPPVLLVTLRASSDTRARVLERGRFAVNVLADDQLALAKCFAGSGDRFAGVPYRLGQHGQPLLADALASFECSVVSTHPFGAMDIVVGSVEDTSVRQGAGPLLYFDRRFHAGAGATAA
jgi:flavin reductase (DIM6/NTAB) family NADH-FMN oxidoreductase RutF